MVFVWIGLGWFVVSVLAAMAVGRVIALRDRNGARPRRTHTVEPSHRAWHRTGPTVRVARRP